MHDKNKVYPNVRSLDKGTKYQTFRGCSSFLSGLLQTAAEEEALSKCLVFCILSVIRGLSLLVLYSAMRGFPPDTPLFPSHQKPTFDLI